ncbi:DUF308 domain-containing protein [uncultured Eubacterium sp.]|uniref:DUF308 domain-containing protein n=1 Tax=uncultured Eubacterium sp. TaxID=165185 RepID=UPI0015AF3EE0|nr:DUF308 domain-containing protein [uncultured Eubacterium sp.]
MTEFIKGLKKFSIATIAVAVVLGIVFIAFPSQCIDYISLIVGISMIAIGVIAIVTYIADRSSVLPLLLGIPLLICGIIVCARYRAIISIIVVLFGIFITTSGLVNIATSMRSLAFNGVAGWLTMALSVVTVIFGIVAITKSSQLTDGIVRFIGAAFIVYAVLGIVSLIQVKHMTDKVRKAVDSVSDIEVDATVESEQDED